MNPSGTESHQIWRKRFAEIFKGTNAEVINLGLQSFFHLGTIAEFFGHLHENSQFKKKFLDGNSMVVHCHLDNVQISPGSFLEFCSISNSKIGANCLLSSIETRNPINIPDETVLFSLKMKDGFVVFAFRSNDDVKKVQSELEFFGKRTILRNFSLWNAPLFSVAESRQKALEMTLKIMADADFNQTEKRISMAEGISSTDFEEMMEFRQKIVKNSTL